MDNQKQKEAENSTGAVKRENMAHGNILRGEDAESKERLANDS